MPGCPRSDIRCGIRLPPNECRILFEWEDIDCPRVSVRKRATWRNADPPGDAERNETVEGIVGRAILDSKANSDENGLFEGRRPTVDKRRWKARIECRPPGRDAKTRHLLILTFAKGMINVVPGPRRGKTTPIVQERHANGRNKVCGALRIPRIRCAHLCSADERPITMVLGHISRPTLRRRADGMGDADSGTGRDDHMTNAQSPLQA